MNNNIEQCMWDVMCGGDRDSCQEPAMWYSTVAHDEHVKRIVTALDEWNKKYEGKKTFSHDFEWEAHMDCLMAPTAPTPAPTPAPAPAPTHVTAHAPAPTTAPAPKKQQAPVPTREDHPGRLVEVYDYVESGDKMKKMLVGHATLIPLERQEFPSKTIFPQEFPTPVVCQEFCDKHSRCHLREEGIGDLCKSNTRFGKLVHKVDPKWSAWHDFRNRLPKTQFVHSTRTGTAPEIALAHWGSPDAQMNEDNNSDGDGDNEYMSPQEQAREIGDKDAIRFIPAFIYGKGKPEWRYMTCFDKQGFPYKKMIKYPSIRPIACKVELKDGYVIPMGKAASSLKITTRADKKRIRAYSAIKKELTQYVGIERAGMMAGQQVAAMATC